ncbi:MAG: Bug family tripartite tricarboxylate transporter substrate binding protein, partial [Burkholderiales bacterium]
MKRRDFVAAGAIAPFAIGSTRAQDRYPTKPIRLVVPFAPGGSSSIVARAFATEMAKGLGQEFVIDNRPGGGGNIAMEAVAKAEPDGYTLIMGHIGTLAVNPFMFSKLPFDTNRDFA